MDISFLIKEIVIGFSIAAPVCPIEILCIRRSLAKGHCDTLCNETSAKKPTKKAYIPLWIQAF